jgi:hypothetical protein
VVERAQLLAINISLPSFLWTKAISIVNFQVNHSPTKAYLGVTAEKKYTSKKLHVDHL